MRLVVSLSFLSLLAGCSVERYAAGTASFTTTPMNGEHSGALPLRGLVCANEPSSGHPLAAIRLGDGCVLVGRWEGQRYGGGTTQLRPTGTCTLPTGGEPMQLRVQTATAAVNERTGSFDGQVDVAVGGLDEQGRYVTYRFTGGLTREEVSGAECDAALAAREDVAARDDAR